MRQILLLVLALQTTTLLAQQSRERVDAANQRFQSALSEELAKTHHEWLYAHCDVFRRVTDARIARALDLPTSAPGAMEVLSDTAYVGDVSHSNDDEDETTVAISRRDQNIIVAASNDIASSASAKAFLSIDAGKTWKTYRLPSVKDNGAIALGDPQLVSDENGEFYYAFLIDAIDNSTGQFSLSDIMIARSSNGKTWTLGTPVMSNGPFTDGTNVLEDKEAIAIDRDPKSPYHGRLYVVWTEYLDGSMTDYIAYSNDSGKVWSDPIALPGDDGYGFFANVRVGPGGTVYIGSSSHQTEMGGNALYVSHDGGQTFVVHPAFTAVQFPENNGYPRLKGADAFRSFPYFAYDVDDSDHVTAAFGTYENDSYAALYIQKSTDEGQNWSDPQAVGKSDALAVDHFQPWVSFDPVTKQTYVSYYSSEEDPLNNVLVREHRVNAKTPSSPEYIGGDLFDPMDIRPGNPFIGDYCESDAYNGTYAVVWTQPRPNGQDGEVFGYVESPKGLITTSGVHQVNAQSVSLSEPYPNPTSNAVSLQVTSNEEYMAHVTMYDANGRELLTKNMHVDPSAANMLSLDVHSFSAGVYRIVVSTPNGTLERNAIVLK